MTEELLLRRKWTLRAHGQQVVFIKKAQESTEHVMMKALLWALYLPLYPDMAVEVQIGDRYKPDLVVLDSQNKPRFWGEAGQVGRQKIVTLVRRYRDTHFVIAKWAQNLDPLVGLVSAALDGVRRTAPFDLVSFPPDSAGRFIGADGRIQLTLDDLDWMRLEPPA
jgi:hypothetical protein